MVRRLLAALLILAPSAAHADDTHFAPPDIVSEEDPALRKAFAVSANPLGALVGRYSLTAEYSPRPHHALVLTPVGYIAEPSGSESFRSIGGEIGYRYYLSKQGPFGPFAGGSFILGRNSYSREAGERSTALSLDYVSYGVAADLGFAFEPTRHMVVALGGGVQYTAASEAPPFLGGRHEGPDFWYGPGLRPRLTASVGVVF
jgi:hypothetical protein